MYPDIYVVCRPESHLREYAPPQPNQILDFYLYKFHFDPPGHRYVPVFVKPISFRLQVQSCQPKGDRNHTLPYILDGYPQEPLKQLQVNKPDPILNALNPHFRMVFRYDATAGVGCLVHFGYDFGSVEDTALSPLWLTALNLELRYHRLEPTADGLDSKMSIAPTA